MRFPEMLLTAEQRASSACYRAGGSPSSAAYRTLTSQTSHAHLSQAEKRASQASTRRAGKDVLVLNRVVISEQLSQPFRIEADLLSEKQELKFEDLIGQSVTITMLTRGDKPRYFNGIVSRFTQMGHGEPVRSVSRGDRSAALGAQPDVSEPHFSKAERARHSQEGAEGAHDRMGAHRRVISRATIASSIGRRI